MNKIVVLTIGYCMAQFNLLAKVWDILLDPKSLNLHHKTNLAGCFLLISSLFCLLIFLPLYRVADYERRTIQQSSAIERQSFPVVEISPSTQTREPNLDENIPTDDNMIANAQTWRRPTRNSFSNVYVQ